MELAHDLGYLVDNDHTTHCALTKAVGPLLSRHKASIERNPHQQPQKP